MFSERNMMLLGKSQSTLRTSFQSILSRKLSLSSSALQVTRLPLLMEFPNRGFPSLIHSARNIFLEKTLITPYFDPDFSLSDFNRGAQQAASTVANSMARGDLESLEHMITPEALDPLRKNLR